MTFAPVHELSKPHDASASLPFAKLLVANRGIVARRVIRAARALGLKTVAVYSEADAGAPHLEEATETFAIGPAPARESYLNQERLIEVMHASGADAVHPGYGFLAENREFAQRVVDAGACFVGPSPHWIETMGNKAHARELMRANGVPVGAGSGLLDGDVEAQIEQCRRIGLPVLVKPAGGGGGIGMIVVREEASLAEAVERARSLAQRTFSDPDVYLERYLDRPRHIEFQMLGDRHGRVRHLFERDCSLQRRHQKILEEAPAPGLAHDPLDALAGRIAEVLSAIGYDNMGTIEMLLGPDGDFSFLEMNTRLQVEHAVTEMLTGIDLVAAQMQSAAGLPLNAILPDRIERKGHAIEARVYAEDPVKFLPSPGKLTRFRPPAQEQGLRVETDYAEGLSVTPFYDPLIANVIVSAPDRRAAIGRLHAALSMFEVEGVRTNIPFLLKVLTNGAFLDGDVHTGMASEINVARKHG